MGPTWGPSGADRTQVVPILAPWTLLSGIRSKTPCMFYAHCIPKRINKSINSGAVDKICDIMQTVIWNMSSWIMKILKFWFNHYYFVCVICEPKQRRYIYIYMCVCVCVCIYTYICTSWSGLHWLDVMPDLRDGWSDWYGTWIDTTLCPLCDPDLWPYPWRWPYFFQGQMLRYVYFRNGWSDWHGRKGILIDRILYSLYDIDLWPLDLGLGFSRSNLEIAVFYLGGGGGGVSQSARSSI